VSATSKKTWGGYRKAPNGPQRSSQRLAGACDKPGIFQSTYVQAGIGEVSK